MHRPLGRTGLTVSAIGYGAVKIGRNQAVKYPRPFDLPDEAEAARVLNAVLDCGITHIDTAPAYGLSEERIGRALAHRRPEFVLSTKVGEEFVEGVSRFDFSAASIRRSVHRSLARLRTDVLDLVLIHSHGDDRAILEETDAVATLLDLRWRGLVRGIGLSGKTLAGAERALDWADAIMVEYSLDDRTHAAVMEEAHRRGVAVLVKKGLGSGRLPAEAALEFVLANSHVTSVVVGGLNVEHLRSNVATAERIAA
ncbi:MAG: aldo/keto reductase [Planctomycetaceae bacterium]